MFEVIYMKAEFEPWWMFSEWEEMIVLRKTFQYLEEAEVYLKETLDTLEGEHTYARAKEDCFFAYWSEHEKEFCEGCDEDLQIYHGILFLKEGEPFRNRKHEMKKYIE